MPPMKRNGDVRCGDCEHFCAESCEEAAEALAQDGWPRAEVAVAFEADAGRCPLPILYLLSADAELDDTVGGQLVYGKSLLHLVANAGERKRGTPLLGLHADLDRDPALRLAYRGVAGDGLPQLIVAGGERELAGCPRASSQCATHQGFDNDPATMNSVLHRILGGAPTRLFSRHDLSYD